MPSQANLLTDWSRLVDPFSRIAARVRPWHLIVATLIVLTLFVGEPFIALCFTVALLLVALAWFREFAFLMRLRDEDFPGRYDKLIWALLLILLPPVGALVFWSYRKAHWTEAKPTINEAVQELS